MFRITRGLNVQHVHFPFPLLGRRELDEDEETGAAADPPQSATPAAEDRVEPAADRS